MKMRIGIVIGCILAILCIVALGLFLFFNNIRNNTMDGSGMINVRAFDYLKYSRGGGEFGEIYTLTVHDEVLDYVKCEGNGYEKVEKTVAVDDDTYNEIMSLLSDADVRNWTNLPKNEYTADDEIRTDFEVTFVDGLNILVAHEDIAPDGGWENIKEIVRILDELATK